MSDPKRVVKLAKQFREVLEVAEDLEKVGDLEQVLRGAEGAAAVAKQDEGIARDQLDEVLALVAVAEDDLKLAKKMAGDTIALSKEAAQEIVDNAKHQATDSISSAQAQIDGLKRMLAQAEDEHIAFKTQANQEQAEISEQTEKIKVGLAELQARIGGQ